jgi:ribosome maturation factor RimP
VAYAGVAKAVIEIEFKQPATADLKLLDTDSSGMIDTTGKSTESEPEEESK